MGVFRAKVQYNGLTRGDIPPSDSARKRSWASLDFVLCFVSSLLEVGEGGG